MLMAVDYDARQHTGYAAGRDFGHKSAQGWSAVFAANMPYSRPLEVLDLGSGTGRFTPILAETFGSALGVEPSERMRAIAEADGPLPYVRYVAGLAEDIPVQDASYDLVLMFLSWHHVQDRPAAASEIARVLRPGGRLMIRSQFSDRFPDLRWHAFFPRAREIELQMFPTLREVEALFADVGLHRVALVEVQECMADSLAEHAERLQHRAISTFEHMSEDEIRSGFDRLDRAVADEEEPLPVITRSDLLIMGRT